MRYKCLFCLCFYLIFDSANCAKILALFYVPTYSHYILGAKLLRPLAEKGHHVSIVTPYKLDNPPQNWREFFLDNYIKNDIDGTALYKIAQSSYVNKEMVTHDIGFELLNRLMKHPTFNKVLNLNETFDVIIIERFMNEALLGLSHHFKAPYIWFSTIGYTRWINDLAGIPGPPSYIPDLYLSYPYNMNFQQRFLNTMFYCFAELYNYFKIYPTHKRLLKEHFPDAPELDELYYNASLFLVNTHVSIKYALPHVHNTIDIGGYHVSPPQKLPKDIQEYLDNAKEGVIYFSLGSAIKSKDMPDGVKKAILSTFSKLKCKVLWKWEGDANFNVPGNVKLGKWFPQQDVLAHPNIILFISHAGLLSTTEAIYHGVPILAVPLFAEQPMNGAEIEQLGYGLQLSFLDLTEEIFGGKIQELLTNPRYKKNMLERSKIFHDRETKPIDRAIYWIEYVVRHKGAPHLKSITLNLKWYQYFLLDVIFLAAFVFIMFIIVIWQTAKFLLNKRRKLKSE